MANPKISIIGAGNVGGLTALRIAQEKLADVVLIDVVPGLAKAKAFDLEDSRALVNSDYSVFGSDNINDLADSRIVVITAGLARKPGMTREDLLNRNKEILKGICDVIKDRAQDAVVIVVTNPLDAMTYFVLKTLAFDKTKVFGMGLTLDSSRFINMISKELNISCLKVSASVLGSHGESMLPLPRFTIVNGKHLPDICDKAKIEELVGKTVDRGKEIVSLLGNGSAYFAPSAAITQLVRTVINDEKRILGVSCLLSGEYGVKGVCAGVPCFLGKNGIDKIIEIGLNEQEKAQFIRSCESIRELIVKLKI
jgi:malate dehydrogenase